jgi:hypothetical protein
MECGMNGMEWNEWNREQQRRGMEWRNRERQRRGME